jgi:hypothetical protein
MSDEHTHLDSESRSLLRELWATPVSRRWVLKAGLGSAAAMAMQLQSSPAVAAPTRVRSSSALHFALATATGVSDLVLVANGARFPLVAHTAASRAALKTEGGLWGVMDLSALTHYVSAVPFSVDRGMVVSVYGRRGQGEVVVSQLWRVPPKATRILAQAAHRFTGSLRSVLGSPARLRALGLLPFQISSPEHVVQLETIGDPHQTATTLTMLHPNVATIDPTASATTKALLGQTPEVEGLGTYIANMQQAGTDFATLVQATDPDGSPTQIQIGDTTTTFSTIQLNREDSGFVAATKSAVSAGVLGVRDEPTLGAVIDKPLDQTPPAAGQTWVQSQGVAPQPQPYSPLLGAGAGLDIKLKNTGFLFGTQTVVNGPFASGKVPLKIYNNYVRWMWVYVQYLGAGGTNLSLNPNAVLPDTKYSKSLAIFPQVFTILGVPLWDTNTIDVTLDFPQGAHTARLLYCGLGSDIVGGGWRQYFPADAYPDRIAPTDEVIVPALITGILTIGLTCFALVTDFAIASAWSDVKSAILAATTSGVISQEIAAVVQGVVVLTAAEALAAATAAGGATYADIKNSGGNLDNLWGILASLGSIIPKVVFNPKAAPLYFAVARALLGRIAAQKVVDALPVIGEVVAIISIIGDTVTLAEAIGETIASPWVIENEVTLTYQATVTISRDPSGGPGGTFPVTAQKWRLEALVDGALTLDPITGTINEGGRIRSDPLALTLTAPFGGKEIQWSVAMLDGAGHQVATGVSPQLPNDNPAQPPSVVSFAITQLPAPVTASTVFTRTDTTTYSPAAGGYTWSNQVSSGGTVASGGIQEVTGVAVATLAGVAGVVWKQGDRYYLRGVPVAENGTTIELRTAPKEGYSRRPFLLFDAFVERTDEGNHLLLEPDETTDAYNVRRVSLDPATGAIDWDPTVSYGTFTLPVSAAALHSSGRVIALHTDNGRLGVLQPIATPRAHLAAYSAGPGSQIGLLRSPIAVAVTNPGVVLILEAGASQLSAFDLNGNPVRYFGAGPTLQFTLPLASQGTYLDLAVDGASQIYLLYYTGDGSLAAHYRVDVYTPTGAPFDTNSPGVNVPHLAVDYWRSIFGANYDPLTDLGTTTPHIDPELGVAEPSLSRFDPITPSRARRRRR